MHAGSTLKDEHRLAVEPKRGRLSCDLLFRNHELTTLLKRFVKPCEFLTSLTASIIEVSSLVLIKFSLSKPQAAAVEQSIHCHNVESFLRDVSCQYFLLCTLLLPIRKLMARFCDCYEVRNMRQKFKSLVTSKSSQLTQASSGCWWAHWQKSCDLKVHMRSNLWAFFEEKQGRQWACYISTPQTFSVMISSRSDEIYMPPQPLQFDCQLASFVIIYLQA